MCLFCEIAGGKRPAQVVYEDDVCIAFLDIDPIQEGHVLLIPKMHCLDADDMPENIFVHLMRISQRLVGALKRAYTSDGYSVMQNGGAFNDIGHYHMHIFPRNEGDGFGWNFSEKRFDAGREVAEKIRQYL